mmetsp:Transcript_49166/g.73071  ORF Transcript_49166/g.73071 Transcript_49166/m.73071 type:complete len:269 (-) Transcript_49166:542-1348(-)|eukprot:CAMPEP_0195519330 /NCGR_PEP_ID=MMETSP0794_2-20130614/14580_1 /TAXON_ID=515487 /ORGANISM="Stephanopyxis turris, Strain CCMP 815" /LENGTH=268 /DNA_ID=CAMNT_0040648457 /DNA_START=243 /DNA_END=1049 /DNA_ORIENTATION=-
MLRLYGHYVSQPSRSLIWLLKLQGLPFEFHNIDPTTGAIQKSDYASRFPTRLIPAIVDPNDADVNNNSGGGFALSEASAIMIYLCRKHKWDEWYPYSNDDDDVARIHEYFSSHNESTRTMTRKVFRPALNRLLFSMKNQKKGKKIEEWNDEEKAALQHTMFIVAKRFQDCFLHRGTKYIAGDTPTIADLLAYPELAQVPQVLGYDYHFYSHNNNKDNDDLSRLRQWLDAMSQLPHHDDVHLSVYKLGEMFQKVSAGTVNSSGDRTSKL